MVVMRSQKTAVAAGVLAALAIATPAEAAIKEIGAFDPNARGSCPSKPCFAFSRTTGYQAKVGDTRNPMAAPADGKIVAFTVGLGKPGPTQTKFFETNLGKGPSLRLTILNAPKKLRTRAVAQSDPIAIDMFMGQTVQFALPKALPVKKGQIIGITTSTWAPILTINQPATTSWRASRNKGGCDDVSTQTAQVTPNSLARYYCLYKGVRLAYSATFIEDPTPNPAKKSR